MNLSLPFALPPSLPLPQSDQPVLPVQGVQTARPAAPFFMAAPETLHPALWRASQLGAGRASVTPSGFALLDAQLPGGGWPHGVLTELLLAHPGLGEMRLLAPALVARCVMLFEPPAALCGWALGQLGLDVRQWLVVQGRIAPSRPQLRQRLGPGADVLWALEQALRSGHLGAALAWLPAGCKADVLRRLQLAAQAHDGPVFLFREVQARQRPSVAPLRLLLAPAGVDALALRVLKRRGPALAEPLQLALPPVLSARQKGRSTRLGRPGSVPEAMGSQAADRSAFSGSLQHGHRHPLSV